MDGVLPDIPGSSSFERGEWCMKMVWISWHILNLHFSGKTRGILCFKTIKVKNSLLPSGDVGGDRYAERRGEF
jgi:hypothetical protein